jgi:glycosyltransferase involved in cell wall biosynthesis
LRALAADPPSGFHITVILASDHDAAALPRVDTWQWETCRSRSALIREVWEFPRIVRGLGADVLVTTTERCVRKGRARILVYLFEDPVYRTRFTAMYSNRSGLERFASITTYALWLIGLRRADHIICASTSTARDLLFWRGRKPDHLSVCAPGPLQDFRRGCAPREPIILAFVDRDLRDNGLAVLHTLEGLPKPWTVRVIGDCDPRVIREAESLGLSNIVEFSGRVSHADLQRAYDRASVYLDMSLYEGFGSQAVEAWDAGLTCVVSGVASLPEVTGYKAVYVDPHDVAKARGVLHDCLKRLDAESLESRGNRDRAWETGGEQWGRLVEHLVERVMEQCQDRVA